MDQDWDRERESGSDTRTRTLAGTNCFPSHFCNFHGSTASVEILA